LSALGLYIFVVHSATSEHPFFDPRLLRDRNFISGILCIAVVGVILFATLALLPTLMQDLLNYPVMTAGLILAPRGMGTMVAMMLVGPLMTRIDARLLMLLGLVLTAVSLYEMTGFSLQMDQWLLIRTGIVQGLGIGFVFPTLSTLAFATLVPQLRTEAAGIFSLMRNIGASVGIAIVESVLVRNIQINHASLVQHLTPYNPALQMPGVSGMWNLNTTAGLMSLDAEVNRQAAMIAYINDFKFMMIVTLATIPMLLLLRNPRQAPSPEALGEGVIDAALD
jgi:DHA2 family multidrug resistance protein